MPIIPPDGAGWRNPYEGRPPAVARRTGSGNHVVTMEPGAAVAYLAGVLAGLPADAVFLEHYGEVDLAIVFRPLPQPPAPDSPPPGPAGGGGGHPAEAGGTAGDADRRQPPQPAELLATAAG
jgi:uncharacterized repeat protein (TIGR03917 family)